MPITHDSKTGNTTITGGCCLITGIVLLLAGVGLFAILVWLVGLFT